MKSIDWRSLKREFFVQTKHPAIRSFLRSKGFSEEQLINGNTNDNTLNWSQERATYQQEIIDERLKAIKENESKRIPDYITAKLNLLRSLIQELEKDNLSIKEKVAIWKVIKTEIGEPTQIAKNENVDLTEYENLKEKLKHFFNEQPEDTATSADTIQAE